MEGEWTDSVLFISLFQDVYFACILSTKAHTTRLQGYVHKVSHTIRLRSQVFSQHKATYTSSHTTRLRTNALTHYKTMYTQGLHKLSHTTRLRTYTSSLTLQGYVHTRIHSSLTLQGYLQKLSHKATYVRTQALSHYKATYTQGYVGTQALSHYKATYTSSLTLQGYL